MGKFMTTEMFEEWRQQQLGRYEKNPSILPSWPNPIFTPRDPRPQGADDLKLPAVFIKTTGARGHCPDCNEWGNWAEGSCPHCGLTIATIVERSRPKPEEELLSAEPDPDLSWPGDGTRWDNI